MLWQTRTATLSPAPRVLPGPQWVPGAPVLTRKLPKDSPELSDVGGKGDVGVQDDDLGKAGGQRLGKRQLHQPVDAGVVLVGDPRHLRLQSDMASGLGTAMPFPCPGRTAVCARHPAQRRPAEEHNRAVEPAEPGAYFLQLHCRQPRCGPLGARWLHHLFFCSHPGLAFPPATRTPAFQCSVGDPALLQRAALAQGASPSLQHQPCAPLLSWTSNESRKGSRGATDQQEKSYNKPCPARPSLLLPSAL